MWLRLAILSLTLAWIAPGQARLTVEQLLSFVRSSLSLKHEDRKLADYLKKVTLRERLDARVVETLQGEGIGPRTVEALRLLSEASKDQPVPVPPKPKPTPAPIPPPSAKDQKRIIEEVREYALNYTKRLPDFICTQVTRRYIDPTGLEFWQRQDVITTKLSFFEQKENYQVILVNSRPVTTDYQKLGGAISAGEFGTMMKEVFDPESDARFTWLRWATLRGRRHHVYQYRVPQNRSKWRIRYQDTMDLVPAYGGLIYVDAESNTVSRLRLEADDIPATFPIQQASVEMDYDLVPIGEQPFMLPLKHTMRMREGKLLVKNEVEFRLYRKFGAEATITFDTPEPLPEDKLEEKPPQQEKQP